VSWFVRRARREFFGKAEKLFGCFTCVPGLKKKVQDPIDAWMQVYYIRTRKRKRKKNGTFPSIITTITTETGCYRASWLDPAAAAAAHLKLLQLQTPKLPVNVNMCI